MLLVSSKEILGLILFVRLDERVLTGKIFLYLERYGYINFGVFKRITNPMGTKKDKPRVIVIGAGIAGIIAARQLQYFGFETIILEGRVRSILVEGKSFSSLYRVV